MTLAVEVQRSPLRFGAGEEDWREAWRRGVARHLAIRIGKEEKKEEEKKKKKKKTKKEEDELIKSSNPHLPGGEETKW